MLQSASRRRTSLDLPLEGAVQAMQPLLLTGEGLYVLSLHGTSAPGAVMVSAQGVTHPLRRLCDTRVLRAHGERLNANRIRARLAAELAARRTGAAPDLLMFFIDLLLPGLSDRDHGGDSTKEICLQDDVQFDQMSEWPMDLELALQNAPVPALPSPSLWVLGRAWILAISSAPPPSVHIKYDGRLFEITGQYITVKSLREQWDAAVSQYCKAVQSELLPNRRGPVSERLRMARADLATSGVVVRGDILYLATNPIRVGHMIPPHHNITLGGQIDKVLALTAPLHFPPRIPANSDLVIFRRSERGSWEALVRAVCLGAVRSVGEVQDAVEAGINFLAFLRLGAVRIATNGRFHEHDGRED